MKDILRENKDFIIKTVIVLGVILCGAIVLEILEKVFNVFFDFIHFS